MSPVGHTCSDWHLQGRRLPYTSEHLRRELDFEAEARNAERAAANLGNRPDCFVPAVHWDLTRKKVRS